MARTIFGVVPTYGAADLPFGPESSFEIPTFSIYRGGGIPFWISFVPGLIQDIWYVGGIPWDSCPLEVSFPYVEGYLASIPALVNVNRVFIPGLGGYVLLFGYVGQQD